MRNLLLLALMGCSGNVSTGYLAFKSPSVGETFTRDHLGATGAIVAPIDIEVEVDGDIKRVAITQGTEALGDIDGAGKLHAEVTGKGPITLTATAYDDLDVALVTAAVDITIADPPFATCREWLDLYQSSYTAGPANPGVTDPVTANVPINGVSYRFNGSTNPRTTLYGDCTLIRSLLEAGPIMKKHDIVELIDIGVYNYRCIGGGTPPDCPNGISQHAYAKAIDIAGFKTSDGTTYSVLTDWVIDPATTTCTAETDPGKDEFLHRVICELKQAKVWNIVLTPNYNADHRNHFHVDLSPDANVIKRELYDHAD